MSWWDRVRLTTHRVVDVQDRISWCPRVVPQTDCKHEKKWEDERGKTTRAAQTTQGSGLSAFMLQRSPVRFLYTTYGPCSTKRPNMEVPPGPPCNHSRTGDFSLPCRSDQDTARGEFSAPPSGRFSSLTTSDLGKISWPSMRTAEYEI